MNPTLSFLKLSVNHVNLQPLLPWLSVMLTPNPLATYSINDFAGAVVVSNGIAFVALTNSLLIVDINVPSYPRFLSSYPAELAQGQSIAVLNNTVFLASFYALQIIDVQNPRNPVLLSNYSDNGLAIAWSVIVSEIRHSCSIYLSWS